MLINSPLVAIIIPCYNQGKYLSETLDSVVTQSYENWECLIINDGSTDNTEEIGLLYMSRDNRFKYTKQENKGLSAARNRGIQLAKGEYIQLLDSDDLIEEKKIETQIIDYQLSDYKNNIILYSSMRYFEDGYKQNLKIVGRDNFIGHVELKNYDSIACQFELLKSRNLCVISAPLYPKKLFDEVGLFDTELKALEDWDLHIRCIKNKYKFHHVCCENANTFIRLHDKSMMRNNIHMSTNFEKFSRKHFPNSIQKKEQSKIKSLIKEIFPPFLVKLLKRIWAQN